MRRLLSSAPPYAYATDNDIVYAADGSIHVAWYDSQAGSLEYASRSASGAWSNSVTIDSIANLPANTAGVGQYVTLALDAQNRPAVAYFDAYNGDLKFASRSTGTWVINPTNIENTAALYPSLVFNGGDAPVISYYIQSTRDLKLARWTGSTWHRQTVDGADDVGRSSSIHRVPGSIDRIAIAYEKTTGGDFKYAEVTTAGLWDIVTVDTVPVAGGGFTSLDFDGNNNPAFSYYDSWTSTLMYASRSGSTWTPIAISGRISHWSNLWFNPTDGSGHLIYYDVSGNLVNHLTKTPTGGWTGPNAELRLGSGNYVQAAFKNDGTIAYTHGSPYADAVPMLGVGVLAGNLVQQPTLGSTPTVVSYSRIDVAWTYSGTANSGFKVGVSTDGGRTFPDERVVASASARSAQITGLAGSTTYTFTVRAYNASGDSTFSNTAAATTPVAPPAAPGGLAATAASASQVDLSWTDVANETSYKIERSLTGTGDWTQIAQPGANVTSHADSGLSGNTTYYYRIRASNASGDSAYATFAAATTHVAVPANFAAAAQSTSRINLAWSAVSGATGYVVQEFDGAAYVDVATLAAGATSHSVGGLNEQTGYTFRIYATGSGGNSATASATATTPARTVGDPTGTPAAQITDAGAGAGDAFGSALAAKGNLILSGNGWLDGGIGGAVVVDAVNGTVVRRFANPAAVPDADDAFGLAVAFVGDRIAISAPVGDIGVTPKVYVYDDLEDAIPDLVLEGVPGDGFGQTLAAIGDDLLVQTPLVGGNGSEGEVRRYDLSTGQVKAAFLSPHPNDLLGLAMAADAATDTVLLAGRTGSGASVIEFNATTGVALREFAVPGGYDLSVAYAPGSIFIGDSAQDAVYQYDRADPSSVPAPVYTWIATANTQFGGRVAVSGNQLLVTAPSEQIVNQESEYVATGAAYVYDITTHALVQRIGDPTPDPINGAGLPDNFAATVAVLGGGQFVLGDPCDDALGLYDVGSLYTFAV